MTTGRINQIAVSLGKATAGKAVGVLFSGRKKRPSFGVLCGRPALLFFSGDTREKGDLRVRSQSAASLRGQTIQDRRGVVTVKGRDTSDDGLGTAVYRFPGVAHLPEASTSQPGGRSVAIPHGESRNPKTR